MLGNFQHQSLTACGDFHLQSVQNLRKFILELNIDNGTNYLGNLTGVEGSSSAAVGTNTHCNPIHFGDRMDG
jgi:hypothetical protein